MTAPAALQSGVGPFFESKIPLCGSFEGVFGLEPSSGNPIPPSHADVTILLPAGELGPQSPTSPTNVSGTAESLLSSSFARVVLVRASTMRTVTTLANIVFLIFDFSLECGDGLFGWSEEVRW